MPQISVHANNTALPDPWTGMSDGPPNPPLQGIFQPCSAPPSTELPPAAGPPSWMTKVAPAQRLDVLTTYSIPGPLGSLFWSAISQ